MPASVGLLLGGEALVGDPAVVVAADQHDVGQFGGAVEGKVDTPVVDLQARSEPAALAEAADSIVPDEEPVVARPIIIVEECILPGWAGGCHVLVFSDHPSGRRIGQ